jgi:NADPH-dependent 2,4-dienoyl-CoA reductase/sulfur reductase-like enzyme
MVEPDVLVIGGGPAGMAAATEVARTGYMVELVEQRDTLGGAIYRQPIAGVERSCHTAQTRARWQAILSKFSQARIPVHHNSVFLGVDGDGVVLLDNRRTGHIEQRRPRSVIIACGAVEKVLPRPGWHLPGVSTAGGLQVMMKETGRAPEGNILLAGSGPLLIAVAAQMARLGNPPVAIVEAGDPLQQVGPSFAMLPHLSLLREAVGYLAHIYARRIPWIRAARLVAIQRNETALLATIRSKDGKSQTITADRVGLHDGIRPNDFGLPPDVTDSPSGPFVLRAGDCREALGAFAADADGKRAGQSAVAVLSGKWTTANISKTINRARKAQDTLSALFAPSDQSSVFSQLPDETVLCRCEGKTIGDLRQLCDREDLLSGREVKHNGRFAMGACQGRFCAANTAALMAELNPGDRAPTAQDLTGRRWPLRPVSIAALTGANSTPHDNN